ncbi:hypothetical protein [Qingshengfaniella alkalisoli]|uniref:Uncharacterized protein n=1 Tax=Qingshengfaniella alkalisoli TaxID=2599296 RepID=A0A5B8IXI0_9RHOB|nr:hypothetical protein [Qingshengfaniella alkalisoli]QDY70424.1 hypothetical protein FPZ52_11960 [Qingshengfaniella alkalisoli]
MRIRPPAGVQQIFRTMGRGWRLFDLSETALATRVEVSGASFAYLLDILPRLPALHPEDIPGGSNAPPIWHIPQTEIAIRKVEEGEQRSAYLSRRKP